MSTKISDIIVTPDVAADLLSQNTTNRPLSRPIVSKYARMMAMGRWIFNGDTITRSNGVLIDGQHRLAAVVKSGFSIRCILVDGVDAGAFATKDAGKPRTYGDLLSIGGFRNANALGAAATTVMKILEMQRDDSAGFYNKAMDNASILDWVVKNPELSGYYTSSKMGVGRNTVRMAMCFLYQQKGADISAFMNRLNSGVGLTKTDPAYHLREYLVRRRESGGAIERRRECAMFIKCINADLNGIPMKLLKFLDDERFPKIPGY